MRRIITPIIAVLVLTGMVVMVWVNDGLKPETAPKPIPTLDPVNKAEDEAVRRQMNENWKADQAAKAQTPPQGQTPEPTYPDRTLVLIIAKNCSNSEEEINAQIDRTVASIEKFTGRPSSRGYVITHALSIIEDAKKDRKYPRNKDGKLEFGAIAAGIQIRAVEYSKK